MYIKKVGNKQNNLERIFCLYCEGHWRKEQDPDPDPDPLLRGTDPRGSGSVPNLTDPEHCFSGTVFRKSRVLPMEFPR